MSVDVTRLLASRDCTTAGWPNETDGPDGLCRTCRAALARPRPAWDPTEALRAVAPARAEPRVAAVSQDSKPEPAAEPVRVVLAVAPAEITDEELDQMIAEARPQPPSRRAPRHLRRRMSPILRRFRERLTQEQLGTVGPRPPAPSVRLPPGRWP